MNTVVEMGGTGAHEKRHSQGEDVVKTTNIVFTTQFNSLEEVVTKTSDHLKNELSLQERNDYYVPSLSRV